MKNLLFTLCLLLFLLNSCTSTEETPSFEENDIVNIDLVTFIPDSSLDNTHKGKYVGVIGHQNNRQIHGKVYINSGQHNQFDAFVKMTNSLEYKFKGTPQNKDGSIVLFEGKLGSFLLDTSNFENIITANIQLYDDNYEGYIVLKKSTRGDSPYIITGTYEDSTSPSFNGNWDLIGDGVATDIGVDLVPPLVPFPITIFVTIQNVSTLSVSHSGSSNPLIDTNFETNTAVNCIEGTLPGSNFPDTPFVISADIPNPLGGVLGGEGSISSGGQTSIFNGSTATWSLLYGDPIPAVNFPGGFTDESCMPATSGTWSWNGRSGTISIDGI